YYRETELFKKLEAKYLSKATDVSIYESVCFALATNNIRNIIAKDLVLDLEILNKQEKDRAVQSCLAGLSFTAMFCENNAQQVDVATSFKLRDILSKRDPITFINLAYANLNGSLLNGQNFTGANLRNAQFINAKLEHTNFS